MNTKRLAQIINDPRVATDKDVKKINALSDEYPYSPFLKVLQARLDNLHESKDKAKSLTKAAIYIADRSILKDFITNDKLSIPPSKEMPAKAKDKKDKKFDATAAETVKEKEEPKDEKATIRHKEIVAIEGAVEEVKEKQPKEAVREDAIEDVAEDVAEESLTETTKQEEVPEVREKRFKSPEEILEEKQKGKQEIVPESTEKESEHTETVEAIDEKILEEDAADVQPEIKKTGEESSDISKSPDKDPEITEKDEERSIEAIERDQYIEADFKADTPEAESDKSEPTKKEDSDYLKPDDDEDQSSSLSKEIMKNISELKKHKASLLNLLHIQTSQPDKPAKKGKKKKKDGDKKKDKSSKEFKSQKNDLKASPTSDDTEKTNYPDYEEEDPVVIKDFLTKLEETNPPPKKKLKREEQEKLIEKFINSDPQMKNVRSSKELTEKRDLSAHSVKFRDDIISENLANIMIKQGKHEKAIDIYKKLIWKFPQKKAYFATQIEELKKKLNK